MAHTITAGVIAGEQADQQPQPLTTHSAPQVPSRAQPGEGVMGEGLPHALGGSPGGATPPGR
jgi:hypothetical protein